MNEESRIKIQNSGARCNRTTSKVRGKVKSRWFETRWAQTHLQLSGLMSKQFSLSLFLSATLYFLLSSLSRSSPFPMCYAVELPITWILDATTVTFHGRTSLNLHLRRLHLLLLYVFFCSFDHRLNAGLMKIIKLVALTGNFSERTEGTGAAEPSNRESLRATGWFVNVQSGTTSRARLANLYL